MPHPARRIVTSIGLSAGLLLAAIAPSQAASPHDDQTLRKVAPEVLTDAVAATGLRNNSDGSRSLKLGSNDVTLPATSDQKASLSSGDKKLEIELPASHKKAKAVLTSEGQIQFNNRDGSLTTTVAKTDGSLQIATTITNSAAPTSYEYGLTLPAGAKLELRSNGGVDVIGSDGKFLGGAAEPWAVDAAGTSLATHYEVEGQSITQVVEHAVAGVIYPVVADPWFGIDLYYSPYVSFVSQGYKINVTPTNWGTNINNRGIETWWAHRDEVKTKLGGNAWRWTDSIQEQFYCHIRGVPASLPEYNMESWRPTINWAESLTRYRCNPYDGYWS